MESRKLGQKMRDNDTIHRRLVQDLTKWLTAAEKANIALEQNLNRSQEKEKCMQEQLNEMQKKLTRISDKADDERQQQAIKYQEVSAQNYFSISFYDLVLGDGVASLGSVAGDTQSWPGEIGEISEHGRILSSLAEFSG